MKDQKLTITTVEKKKEHTRLHIHPLNPPISSEKSLNIRLPGIKFNITTKDGPHICCVPTESKVFVTNPHFVKPTYKMFI